ncbi:flagellin, partial [Campylobacter sp. W0045]|nr:flagellin [Campylobacter sp. W0045]
IGGGAGILQKENYGRLSLVKNDGRDINIGGTGLSAIGMGATDLISQTSISLRESKGQIDANTADAMGFNAYGGGGKQVIVGVASSIDAFMAQKGSGFSAGSGFSVGSGKSMSVMLDNSVIMVSTMTDANFISAYKVSKGSGFSSGSGQSQFATLKISAGNAAGAT